MQLNVWLFMLDQESLQNHNFLFFTPIFYALILWLFYHVHVYQYYTSTEWNFILMQVGIYERNRPKKRQKTKKNGKGKDWLLRKKEQMRRRGHDVPADTKYTGRKRKSYF